MQYHGTSIRDNAREVNLSIATLYYYVQNKDDLYVNVFQGQYIEEAELIGNILASAMKPPPATLPHCGNCFTG